MNETTNSTTIKQQNCFKKRNKCLLEKLKSNFLLNKTIYLRCNYCDFYVNLDDCDEAIGKNLIEQSI